MKNLIVLLLIGISFIKIATCKKLKGPPPEYDDKDDKMILKEFENLKVRRSDCNKTTTEDTIEWLAEKNDTRKKINMQDHSMSHFDLEKLRKYLYRKGFVANPGTVHFVNHQDTVIRLECGGTGDARWRSVGRLKDRQLKDEHRMAKKYTDPPPQPSLYFRRFTCARTDPKSRCVHFFYVITRPSPKVTEPLQYREGENVEFECNLNPCSYNGEKCPKLAFPSNFHAPVKMMWKLKFRNQHINHGDINFPLNIKVDWFNETNAKNLTNEWNDKADDFFARSTIKISKVEPKHAGRYECIIIDSNGVPSIPTKNTIKDHDFFAYHGEVVLHVREWYWVYVPAGIIGGIIVIMFFIQCFCPARMEYDDGTPYTKAELDLHTHHGKNQQPDAPDLSNDLNAEGQTVEDVVPQPSQDIEPGEVEPSRTSIKQ